jgi:DNA polymerase-1
MLFNDKPCRLTQTGTFPFAPGINAVYTLGREHVREALEKVFQRTDTVSADIESHGLGLAGRRLKSVQIGDAFAAVILDPRDPYQADLIRKTFERAKWIVFHNSSFDIPNLYINGLIRLADITKVIDTILYDRLATPGETVRKSLEASGARHLGTHPGGELVKAFKALNLSKTEGYKRFDLDRPIYVQGAASDPVVTAMLLPVVRQAAYNRLTKGHPFTGKGLSSSEAWDLVEREQRINRVLLARSARGFRVDFEYADNYRAENALELAEAEEALVAAGVRPGNTGDLARVLEERGALPPNFPRTPKTNQPQMTEKTLKLVPDPLAKLHTRHAKIKKIGDDYIEKCVTLADENGLIHPPVGLLAAATGRASMSDPPLHQFSGPARGMILADAGDKMTSIDWSQIEPVVMANAAHDHPMIAQYESGTVDVYVALAVLAGYLPKGTTTADCDRDKAKKAIRSLFKVVILALLYGEGMPKLSASLGLDAGPYKPASERDAQFFAVPVGTMLPQYAAAKKLRDDAFRGMPKVTEMLLRLRNVAKQYKKTITVGGRVLDIPMGKFNGRWSVETHKGINYFCQGSAYDVLADSLDKIIAAGLGDAIYLTMHDELIVSTSAAHDIQKIMETPSDRLCLWAGRTPVLRTDRNDFEEVNGERWMAA